MEVKCPKCRYKFNMTAVAGMNELSCVCPRCGTPFTYTIPGNASLKNSWQETTPPMPPSEAENSDSSSNVSPRADESVREEHAHVDRHFVSHDDLSAEEAPSFGQKSRHIHGGTDTQKRPRRFTCLKSCLLIVLACFVLSMLLARTCTHSYTAADLRERDADTENVSPDSIADRSDTDDFSNVHSEPAPGWIQGSWAVQTDEGAITLAIRGNTIAETFADKTRSGTFYYSQGAIYFNGGHGNVTVYRLDLKHHEIDAGGGNMMHRAE